MVPPWIWYSIWKFWVIYVLVSLVFHVFSTAELISLAKTVNLAVWPFSLNFLHEFTLYVIDMHQNMHISLFKKPFDQNSYLMTKLGFKTGFQFILFIIDQQIKSKLILSQAQYQADPMPLNMITRLISNWDILKPFYFVKRIFDAFVTKLKGIVHNFFIFGQNSYFE